MNQDFLGKMTNGEKAILGGSLLVLIFLFFPWYGWDVVSIGFFAGQSASFNGFYGWGWLTFLALLAVVGFWVVRTFLADDVKLPDLPVSDPAVYMILGAVEVLGTVLYWAGTGPSVNIGFTSQGVRYGLFLTLIGGVVTIIGGYLKQSEPQAAVTSAGGGGGGSVSGPPQSFTPASYAPPQPPQPQFTTPPPPPTGPPSAPPPPSAPTAQPPESAPPES
jgi:hypothetical protein